MRKLSSVEITSKSVEISKCLLSGAPGGLINYDMGTTQTTGDAARLAVSLRNRQQYLGREVLAAVCSALKIDYRLAESSILPNFEELGWVKVKRSNHRIEALTETLPPTEDIMDGLGRFWIEQNPTKLEEASLVALADLSIRPKSSDALISDLGLSTSEYNTVFDYGESARYLGKFVSEEHNKETLWTPLYWSSNADAVMRFLKRQDEKGFDKLALLTEKFKNHPGLPADTVQKGDLSLVNRGIYNGFFPSISIGTRKGNSYSYIFSAAPQFSLDKSSDLFERARMIVGCIRHGQYHAEVSKINKPLAILRHMRANTMAPHPYADTQYALLVLHGIVRLEKDFNNYGPAWKVVWIGTPENNLAGDLAELLLQGQEVIGTTQEELDARKILVKGLIRYSSEERRLKTIQTIMAKTEYERMMELISGVKL